MLLGLELVWTWLQAKALRLSPFCGMVDRPSLITDGLVAGAPSPHPSLSSLYGCSPLTLRPELSFQNLALY